MRFYLGCDHAGFDIKNDVIAFLNNLGCEVVDLGAKSKDSVDYPDFAHAVSVSVLEDKGSFGVLICGTGIGISISANKHAGIIIDLEYDNDPEATQKPALCQLSIGKNHPMLLFQMSDTERCTVFDNFLADPRYTFAGFSIDLHHTV